MGDGFTSPPRKACCGFFRPKIRPGSNPRSWVPEASMLTTRPPKPQKKLYYIILLLLLLFRIYLHDVSRENFLVRMPFTVLLGFVNKDNVLALLLNLKSLLSLNFSPPCMYRSKKVSFRSPGLWSSVAVWYDAGFSKQHSVAIRHFSPLIWGQKLLWVLRDAITRWRSAISGNTTGDNVTMRRTRITLFFRGKATSSISLSVCLCSCRS